VGRLADKACLLLALEYLSCRLSGAAGGVALLHCDPGEVAWAWHKHSYGFLDGMEAL
jgi:hypothetical protein